MIKWCSRWIGLLACIILFYAHPVQATPLFGVRLPTDYVAVMYPLVVTPDRFFYKVEPPPQDPIANACGMAEEVGVFDAQDTENAWSYEQAQALKKWVVENRLRLLDIMKNPTYFQSLRKTLDDNPVTWQILRIFNDTSYRDMYTCRAPFDQIEYLGEHAAELPKVITAWEKDNGLPPLTEYEAHPKKKVWTQEDSKRVNWIVTICGVILLWGLIEKWRKED